MDKVTIVLVDDINAGNDEWAHVFRMEEHALDYVKRYVLTMFAEHVDATSIEAFNKTYEALDPEGELQYPSIWIQTLPINNAEGLKTIIAKERLYNDPIVGDGETVRRLGRSRKRGIAQMNGRKGDLPMNKELYIDSRPIPLTTDEREGLEDIELIFPENIDGYGDDHVQQPLDWVNSANIVLQPEEDAIKVMVSVDSPLGAFVFSVRRTTDGRMLLHMPYEGMGFAHMPIKHLQDGTFEVVNG